MRSLQASPLSRPGGTIHRTKCAGDGERLALGPQLDWHLFHHHRRAGSHQLVDTLRRHAETYLAWSGSLIPASHLIFQVKIALLFLPFPVLLGDDFFGLGDALAGQGVRAEIAFEALHG
jgi:hypothetical protein